MPLNTKIVRDGKLLLMREDKGWTGFHVVAMTLASVYDTGEGPFVDNSPPAEQPVYISPKNVWELMGYHILAMTPLNKGKYVLQNEWKFIDILDGEEFTLLPGDELHAWRN